MNKKVKPTTNAGEVTDNRKSFDSREQNTPTPPFMPPILQSPPSTEPLPQTEPEAFTLAATQQAHNTLFQQMLARLPVPLRRITTRFLEQAEDPDPERMDVKQEAKQPKIIEWGWGTPDPTWVRDHIDQMQKIPFDGLVFTPSANGMHDPSQKEHRRAA